MSQEHCADTSDELRSRDAGNNNNVINSALDYEFFVSTGKVEQIEKSVRKKLRAHVMHNYIQQKQLGPAESARSSAAISSETAQSKLSLQGRFRLNPTAKEAKRIADRVPKDRRQVILDKKLNSDQQGNLTEPRYKAASHSSDDAGYVQPSGCDVEPHTDSPAGTLSIALSAANHRLTVLDLDARLDPFDSLPVPNSPRMESLMYLCMRPCYPQ